MIRSSHPLRLFLIAAAAALGTASQLAHADWPRFHGSDSTGYAENGTLPARWTPQDYAWSVQLSGDDVGSPVIFGQQVFLTEPSIDRTHVDLMAVDLISGVVQWRRPHRLVDRPRHARNSAAATTPAVDEDYVVMAHGDATGASLMAVKHNGEPVWQRDLGSWEGQHGFAASPLIVGEMVILLNEQQAEQLDPGHTPGESRMLAFDRHSGEPLWNTPLKTTRVCYGVPAVYTPPSPGAPTQLIAANTGNGMFGLDLRSGQMLWSLEVFDKRCCNSPVVVDGLAVASCGSGGGGNVISAVRIPTSAAESPEEVFRLDRSAPYVPSPAVRGSLMFLMADNGIASCVDVAREGETLWSARLGGKYGASPIVVGSTVLFLSLEGKAVTMAASEKQTLLDEFDLGGSVGATPAFAHERLVIRVGDQLHCLPTSAR